MRDCGVSGDSGQPSIWARTRAVCLACTLPSLPCGDMYPTWLRVERRCVGVQTSVDTLRWEPLAHWKPVENLGPCGAHFELWKVFWECRHASMGRPMPYPWNFWNNLRKLLEHNKPISPFSLEALENFKPLNTLGNFWSPLIWNCEKDVLVEFLDPEPWGFGK